MTKLTCNSQVIRAQGRIIRLASFNEFDDNEVLKCPILHVSAKDGFYLPDTRGFKVYDVTFLWNKKQGY